MSNTEQSDLQVQQTRSQLAGDKDHLLQLWSSLSRTSEVVRRASQAYQESLELLHKFDRQPAAGSGFPPQD